MRALYWKAPTAAELEGTGLKPKHYVAPEVEVWPEQWPAFELFRRYITQWRAGAMGPTGLDYGPIFRDIDRRGLSQHDQDDLIDDLQVIEAAALEFFREP